MLSLVFEDVLGSVFQFPLWWYGEGFGEVIVWAWRALCARWREYGIALWVRDFFVPMYGFHDWTSRLISMLMRVVILCARLIALVVEGVAYALFCLIWLVAPVVCLAMFGYSAVLWLTTSV